MEHVDEAGNKLPGIDDETISGDFGTSFTDEATAKIKTDIKGYTYKEMTTTNLVGTTYPSSVPSGAMVSLVYKQKPVSLTVKYLDIDTGDPVKTSTTMPEDGSNGLYGESFTLPAAPTLTGYNFVNLDNRHKTTESDYKGTYPDPADKEDIIYYYKIKTVSVDVEYVEAVDGGYQPMNNGDDDYTISKDFGSDYSVTVKTYEGFSSGEIDYNGNNQSKMTESMKPFMWFTPGTAIKRKFVMWKPATIAMKLPILLVFPDCMARIMQIRCLPILAYMDGLRKVT